MAKEYSDIEKKIKESGPDFFVYLTSSLRDYKGVNEALEALSKKTEVYVFSGVIRNFFLKKSEFRDLDLVLKDEVNVEQVFEYADHIRKNSFGGYKIGIGELNIDVWYLKDTWALNYQKSLGFDLEKYVPSTAFFNFSAVIYSYRQKEFFYTKYFLNFLKYKKIDVVYKPNLNYNLCIVSTIYYSHKYKLVISNKLLKFITYLHRAGNQEYSEVQIKHFGKIVFSDEYLNEEITKMNEKAFSK